jgi:hypothetical protein
MRPPPPCTQAQWLERQKVAFKEMDQNQDGQVSLPGYEQDAKITHG